MPDPVASVNPTPPPNTHNLKPHNLTMNTKQQIQQQLQQYAERYPSRNKAAQSLGIAPATLSAILNGKHKLISEQLWRRIAERIAAYTPTAQSTGQWQIVPTTAYQEIHFALQDAQQYRNATWIIGEAGAGKTTAARIYTANHRETFYLQCSEDMLRAEFVREIARLIGLRTDGQTIRQIWQHIIASLLTMQQPLLIFDEADKLTESVFHYFISLYNHIEDKCGLIFLSTDHICTRIQRGLRCNKPGYKEFYSRIGRKYFPIEDTSPADVQLICQANGLTHPDDITAVINDTEQADFDLRRVKKAIHRLHRQKNLTNP